MSAARPRGLSLAGIAGAGLCRFDGVEFITYTTADGLATRVTFENTLEMILDPKTGIDDFVLVSDEQMEDAMLLLLEHTHNLAELAGAATLASR